MATTATPTLDDLFGPPVLERFPPSAAPLLHAQRARFRDTQPLANVTILHCVPITLSTTFKILCLVDAGATVYTVCSEFVPSDDEAVKLIQDASKVCDRLHHLSSQPEAADIKFDLLLDTCAEAARYVTPTIGGSELTLTGDLRFREMDLSYPILSVDNSRVKRVEDACGSTDGLMRALLSQIPDWSEAVDRKFVVFGYGKVGLGIAYRLRAIPGSVTVVEHNPETRALAASDGFDVLEATDVAGVEAAVAACYAVVTGTGVEAVISKNYSRSVFLPESGDGPWLANMGAIDEFGFDGATTVTHPKLLFDGRAVNFALKEPTTIGYLDPAFISHNLSAVALIETARRPDGSLDPAAVKEKYGTGVLALPKDIDDAVLTEWKAAGVADLDLELLGLALRGVGGIE